MTIVAETFGESPLTIPCQQADLVGILHTGNADAETGIVIVVGGPQYRVGSHRQFVLLARRLAAEGWPVLRFDYRGMGDSEGVFAGFEAIDDDIGAAVDILCARCPSIKNVVLWGLCDAASAILFYAHRDPRITAVALLNPWVHSEEGAARTYLKHYYLAQLRNPAFWRKLAGGGVDIAGSLKSLFAMIATVAGGAKRQQPDIDPDPGHEKNAAAPDTSGNDALAARMGRGLEKFRGRVLLILSGQDFTAREFTDAAARSTMWRSLLDDTRVTRCDLDPADHTFSRAEWRAWVEDTTINWISGTHPTVSQAGYRAPANGNR